MRFIFVAFSAIILGFLTFYAASSTSVNFLVIFNNLRRGTQSLIILGLILLSVILLILRAINGCSSGLRREK